MICVLSSVHFISTYYVREGSWAFLSYPQTNEIGNPITWLQRRDYSYFHGEEIGDFRVAFRLCFKASPIAKPDVWKLIFFTRKFWFIYMWIRSPSPGASISKVWETTHAQTELFLELFAAANVSLLRSAYGRNQRGKGQKWLRKTDEGCGTLLWSSFFQRRVRSYTDRSGDRSSRETHV